MNNLYVPGFRFRATDLVITQALIGRRLTYMDRLRAGQGPMLAKMIRQGDPGGARKIALLRQRRPLETIVNPPMLLAEASVLHTALTLQAKLAALAWDNPLAAKKIMLGEVPVNLFKLVMADYDFGFGKHEFLYDQLGTPAEQGKSVRAITPGLAKEFIQRLQTLTGRTFRLPTEDEYDLALPVLLDKLWTPCTIAEGRLIYRMGHNRTDSPIETCIGLRLVEQNAA